MTNEFSHKKDRWLRKYFQSWGRSWGNCRLCDTKPLGSPVKHLRESHKEAWEGEKWRFEATRRRRTIGEVLDYLAKCSDPESIAVEIWEALEMALDAQREPGSTE